MNVNNDFGQSSGIKNNMEKILSALAKCEEESCQLIIRRFIYKHLDDLIDNIQNHTNDEYQFDSMLNKLRKIMDVYEIEKYLLLPTQYKQKDDDLTLLGILSLPTLELNYEEKKMLKSAIEKNLLKTINSYLTKYVDHGGNLAKDLKNNESIARQDLLKLNDLDVLYWKSKLDEMCKEHARNINLCRDSLYEWQQLKNEDVEKLNYEKALSIQIKLKITEVQMKIAQIKYSIKMFCETPDTLEAFKILDRKLEEKLIDVQEEIKTKKLLSKQYNSLSGTEYDDILNKYLDLRAAIKKDERLLNNL